MNKFFIALFLVVGTVLAAQIPAGANDVTNVSVNCERVTVDYTHFPTDVTVNTVVTVGDKTYEFSDVTDGDAGYFSHPLDLEGDVEGSVNVFWNVDGEHSVSQDFSFECGTPETTTTTVPTPTTTVPTPATSVPSSTPTSPPNANPPGMPRTGGWAIVGATAVGLAFIGIGIAIQKKD